MMRHLHVTVDYLFAFDEMMPRLFVLLRIIAGRSKHISCLWRYNMIVQL
jgi:hypothetical protein